MTDIFRLFELQTVALCAVIGYFLGNFQTAILLSRRVLHDDVRSHGSGNPGATNMTRSFGTKWGFVTFIGDGLKCLLSVLLGQLMAKSWGLLNFDPALGVVLGGYIGGFFCVLGHCYPVLYRFKGGKGVACSFAFMFLCSPLPAAIILLTAVGLYFICKRISLCSLCSLLLFFVSGLLLIPQKPWLWLFALLCLLVVVVRHKDNIKRLINGTESTVDY